MEVGKRIKQRRKELGYNADYLAAKLGVSRSTIFRYEKGEIEKLPTEVLEKLAISLDTTPGYLMGWTEKPQDKLLNIFNQLDKRKQDEVYNFAKFKLNEQKKEIFTIAAHSEDPNRMVSDEDLRKINSFLDEMDNKFDKK
ncbi:helix-turn-helix domain-containing protein [Enterococcus casseliflavus]|jgi:transcriptional regulator with XRE-family HTH domain|uniref:helix-turn-helix domain-containing protein n=1 Tax=Enterococcus casseliflavus TaxID=37734 RepID=UPI000881ED29|nr:XRE family transcriptional regulator [Enterococcus casseliflavus]MDB1690155.1 helix-turn-helix domain-containing protein [Enterococcus casseliflavus]SDL06085.1 Transcriptional regulator, contains XRE-family HTH domain [Enterococcus casseliflavus]